MIDAEKKETGCCPRFDPAPWDGKEITWQDKLFVKDRVTSVMHIPLNFGGVLTRNAKKIEAAGAVPCGHDFAVLSDERSAWGANIYISATKDVPGAKMDKISGTFLSKVYEGHYKNMGSWIRDMNEYAKSKGKTPKNLYFYYTTCPKCAKAYGKNYVVILAKV